VRVIETEVEVIAPSRIRVTTLIELGDETEEQSVVLGEGPTGDAVPDRIVRSLIRESPTSMSLSEIQAEVGGNAATVSRQAWTLATNQPDLQIRLRGWVTSPERGRYVLTELARDCVAAEPDPQATWSL